MGVLKALCGHAYGRTYPVRGVGCRLGRGQDCDISDVFSGLYQVSRHHAEIVKIGSNFVLRDLDSKWGTWLNGERVVEVRKLNDGDLLSIAGYQFVFRDSESDECRDINAEASESTHFVESGDRETIDSRIEMMPRSADRPAPSDIRVHALMDMLSTLGASLELNEVLQGVLQSLFKIFTQAQRAFVGLKHPQNEALEPAAVLRRDGEGGGSVLVSRTIANHVMNSKEAILSEDATLDPRFDASHSLGALPIRSVMCAPLIDRNGSAFGILQLDTRQENRFFLHGDLEVLVAVSGLVTVAVQYSKLHEDALRQQALERDLALARQIQESLLPQKTPEVNGYDFYRFYRAAYAVGGDYYDYLPLPDGRYAVVVADAQGKGVAAALHISFVSGELKSALAERLSPAEAVTAVNRRLLESECDDRLATLAMVVVDPASPDVEVLTAGHFSPLLRRRGGTMKLAGERKKGFPLGVDADERYQSSKVKMLAGESLTMFTDGFTDAMNDDEQFYGLDRVTCIVSSMDAGDAGQLGGCLVDDVERFVGGRSQKDDMCLVVVHRS